MTIVTNVLQILLYSFFLGTSLGQTEVCYEPCGCFSNAPPFNDRPLPHNYESQNINWLLFTTSNPDTSVPIRWDNIPNEYDASKPTVYLIHGWTSNIIRQLDIKDAFLQNGHDFNIIVVDWEKGADFPLQYPQAASNTRVVGACSGYLADLLSKMEGGSHSLHHCMGHSLGGQTCGYMGKFLKDGDTPRLGRITGLDPAGPLFNTDNTAVRLDKTDTLFMDNIHTNAQVLGIGRDVGHVDLYPNKGSTQPPCDVPDPPLGGNCDHSICRNYVINSLDFADSCTFTAYPCTSGEDADNGLCETCNPNTDCQRMGYYANTMPGRGRFFLRTVKDYPYCEN